MPSNLIFTELQIQQISQVFNNFYLTNPYQAFKFLQYAEKAYILPNRITASILGPDRFSEYTAYLSYIGNLYTF